MDMIIVQQHWEVRWESSGSSPFNTRQNARTFTGATAEADAVKFCAARTATAVAHGHARPIIRRITIEERVA